MTDWRTYSPEAGRSGLLWATLYGVSKNVSGARDVLLGGNTCGRKKPSCRLLSAGNTRFGVVPDSRSGPLGGIGTALRADAR